MPRYYLQVADVRYDKDITGTEFANDTEAQRQAMVFADQIVQSDPNYFGNVDLRLYVNGKDKQVLFSVIIFATGVASPSSFKQNELILVYSIGYMFS